MKPYAEDSRLLIYAGADVAIVAEIRHDHTSTRIAMTKTEAQWPGRRLLEIAGCARGQLDVFGTQPSEAHVFAVGAKTCYCGKATR